MDSTRTYKTIFTYGWHESLSKQFEPYENLGYIPMRIVRQGRGLYRGVSGDASLLLELSGSFLNLQDLGIQQSPVVGDWCAVRQYASDRGRIEAVLPRMNVLHRPVAHDRQGSNGVEGSAKLVAANIDMAAIIQDCRYDFNLRRIERFISLLHTDSIPAILVLTKIDLVEDPEAYRLRALARFPNCRVFPVDSISGNGIDALVEALLPTTTTVLLGTSGAGKSTLVNRLSGHVVAKTADIRTLDGRGRHTTTSRHLHLLPHGALILDTPGIRVVGMNSSQELVHDAFTDISDLSHGCRFSDCTHTGEPGCRVFQALREGMIEQDRYFNYLRLGKEAQSWEEVVRQRKQKKKAIGMMQYRLRREGNL